MTSKAYEWANLDFSDLTLGHVSGINKEKLVARGENDKRGYRNDQYSLLRFFFQYLLVNDDDEFTMLLKKDVCNLPCISSGFEARITTELRVLKKRLSKYAVQDSIAILPASDGKHIQQPRKTAKGETIANVWMSVPLDELTLGSVPGISENKLVNDRAYFDKFAKRGYYNDQMSLLRLLMQYLIIDDNKKFVELLEADDFTLPPVAPNQRNGIAGMLNGIREKISDSQVKAGISPLPMNQPAKLNTPVRRPVNALPKTPEGKYEDEEEEEEGATPQKMTFEDKSAKKGGVNPAIIIFLLSLIALFYSMYLA